MRRRIYAVGRNYRRIDTILLFNKSGKIILYGLLGMLRIKSWSYFFLLSILYAALFEGRGGL